jgi:hypothetical protein
MDEQVLVEEILAGIDETATERSFTVVSTRSVRRLTITDIHQWDASLPSASSHRLVSRTD